MNINKSFIILILFAAQSAAAAASTIDFTYCKKALSSSPTKYGLAQEIGDTYFIDKGGEVQFNNAKAASGVRFKKDKYVTNIERETNLNGFTVRERTGLTKKSSDTIKYNIYDWYLSDNMEFSQNVTLEIRNGVCVPLGIDSSTSPKASTKATSKSETLDKCIAGAKKNTFASCSWLGGNEILSDKRLNLLDTSSGAASTKADKETSSGTSAH